VALDQIAHVSFGIVSKYWDPSWARPTTVVSGPVDRDAILRSGPALQALMPKELQVATVCPDTPGISRHAVGGPDYSVLVPSALRHDTAELQKRIGKLTWYFVCSRPRIRLVADECCLDEGHLRLGFEVDRDDGEKEALSVRAPEPTTADRAEVIAGGETLVLTTKEGLQTTANASMLAQHVLTPDPYQPSVFDLEVRYIGRARGDLAERCALDRLEEHKEYQAVLEETAGHPYRNREVVLMLCAGTTFNMTSFGDHDPTPEEVAAEDAAQAGVRARLDHKVRVDAVEALMINLFKPKYNTHYVGKLNPKWDAFHNCLKAGLTGLTLTFSTDSLRCGLYTEHVDPSQHFQLTVCM
jgi:hypothetical protein